MGIVTIKPFAGGSLFRAKRKIDELLAQKEYEGLAPARAFLKYILQNPDISATIPGMTTAPQVSENVGASAERILQAEERHFLRDAFPIVRHEVMRQYPFLKQWMA